MQNSAVYNSNPGVSHHIRYVLDVMFQLQLRFYAMYFADNRFYFCVRHSPVPAIACMFM